MGTFLSILSAIGGAIGSCFGWLKSRQDAANTATLEQAGAHAQAAENNAQAEKIAQAEGQAVNDTPAGADALADIAKKGKW